MCQPHTKAINIAKYWQHIPRQPPIVSSCFTPFLLHNQHVTLNIYIVCNNNNDFTFKFVSFLFNIL